MQTSFSALPSRVIATAFNATVVLSALAAFMTNAHAVTQAFTATYEVSATIDTTRKTEAAAAAQVAKGAMWLAGGAVGVGTLTDEGSFGDARYRVLTHSDPAALLKMATSNVNLTRQSDGRRQPSGRLYSDRFIEKKGTKGPTVVTMDYGRHVATYMRGSELRKKEALPTAIADSALLPYVFFRQPRFAGSTVVLATDGISTRNLTLDQADATVEVGGKTLPAVKWTRRLANAQDPSFELWVRKEDGFPLRIRVGLSARYGVVLEQKLAKLPEFRNTP